MLAASMQCWWMVLALRSRLFWRDVAVHFSFSNFFCDWPSVDLDSSTAPYDQKDLCVSCRTFTSVELLTTKTAGPLKRLSLSTIASLHDITGVKGAEPTYRVAQKTGPVCFIANILKTPRPTCVEVGELLQYCMLNAVITFLFKSFVALWRHLAKNELLCDAQIYLFNVNKRQQHFNRIDRKQNYSHCGNLGKSQFMKLLI